MRLGTVILTALIGATMIAAKPIVGKEAASAQNSSSVLYDFKGAKLGMSLSEWRSASLPASAGGEAGAYIVCTDSQQPQDYEARFNLSAAELGAGVIECTYLRRITSSLNMRYGVSIGKSAAWAPYYYFLNSILYKISLDAPMDTFNDVTSGLKAKWGEPSGETHDTVQNKLGGSFPHNSLVWRNLVATINVDAPHLDIDQLSVQYILTAKAAKIDGPPIPDKDKM